MPDYAGDRIRSGLRMCGLVVVPLRFPLGQAIDEIELIAMCSLEGEWENKVLFLPLRFGTRKSEVRSEVRGQKSGRMCSTNARRAKALSQRPSDF